MLEQIEHSFCGCRVERSYYVDVHFILKRFGVRNSLSGI